MDIGGIVDVPEKVVVAAADIDDADTEVVDASLIVEEEEGFEKVDFVVPLVEVADFEFL